MDDITFISMKTPKEGQSSPVPRIKHAYLSEDLFSRLKTKVVKEEQKNARDSLNPEKWLQVLEKVAKVSAALLGNVISHCAWADVLTHYHYFN